MTRPYNKISEASLYNRIPSAFLTHLALDQWEGRSLATRTGATGVPVSSMVDHTHPGGVGIGLNAAGDTLSSNDKNYLNGICLCQ